MEKIEESRCSVLLRKDLWITRRSRRSRAQGHIFIKRISLKREKALIPIAILRTVSSSHQPPATALETKKVFSVRNIEDQIPFASYDVNQYDLSSKAEKQKLFIENLKKIDVEKAPFDSSHSRFPHYEPKK